MESNNLENGGFSYTYSAKEQAELKKIRDKYTAPTEAEDKLARLRRLDASVTKTAQALSIALGVIGTLMLGFGMSLIMTDIAFWLGLNQSAAILVGVVVGVFGGAALGFAYPVYNAIVRVKRKQLAPEIIRLADELIK